MVLTTGLNPELLRNNLKLVWGITGEQNQPEWTELFEQMNSSMNFERYQEVTGFGQIPVKTQSGDTEYEDALNGYQKDQVNVSYGLGFSITREMRIYNQYDLMRRWTVALRESVDNTVETLGANVFNNAFDSTAFTLGDGVELCGTHTLPDGNTVANELSVAADLSETSLRQSIIDIRTNFVDGVSKKIKVRGRKLVVHPNDWLTASELLGSDKVPESNNNAINPIKKDNLLPEGYVVNDFLTDDDAFFILTNHSDKLVCQKVVFPAEFDQDNDFDSDNMKMKTFFILSFGAYNFRSIFGSPGGA